MRSFLVTIIITLTLFGHPASACGWHDVADFVKKELAVIDAGLANAQLSTEARVKLAARRAECARLLQEGAVLRTQTANESANRKGFEMQAEASRLANQMIDELKLKRPPIYRTMSVRHCGNGRSVPE